MRYKILNGNRTSIRSVKKLGWMIEANGSDKFCSRSKNWKSLVVVRRLSRDYTSTTKILIRFSGRKREVKKFEDL